LISSNRIHLIEKLDTSKALGTEDYYGGSGTFLSSLSALSVLTITSHHHAYGSTNTVIFHHSRPAARLTPAPSHHSLTSRNHGTRVQVQDLFGNMPVRVKRRPVNDEDRRLREREWDQLRKACTGMFLAWGRQVAFTLQSNDKEDKLRFRIPRLSANAPLSEQPPRLKSFDMDFIRGILQQGAGIDPDGWKRWVKASAHTPETTIRGIISVEPAPSKNTQFISLGNQYVGPENECNILYDEVNKLFSLSTFGAQFEEDVAEKKTRNSKDRRFKSDGFTNGELRGRAKGIDKWPRFFIRIDLQANSSMYSRQDHLLAEKKNILPSVIGVLEAMVTGFLTEQHFRPRKRRPKTVKFSASTSNSPSRSRSRSRKIRKEQPQRHGELEPSELGVNVKLPKFSRTEHQIIDADLSTWSRIKGISKNEYLSAFDSKFPLRLSSKTAVHNLDQRGIDASNEDSTHHSKRLRMLPPKQSITFEHDVEFHSSDFSSSEDLERELATESAIPAETVEPQGVDTGINWTNPITGESVTINARTGAVLREPTRSPNLNESTGEIGSRPSHDRPTSSRLEILKAPATLSAHFVPPEDGTWAKAFLQTWENPIFGTTEIAIPRIVSQDLQLDGKPACCFHSGSSILRDMSDPHAVTLSKYALETASIISQVDKKFILIKVATTPPGPNHNDESIGEARHALILVDQHAADERIRVEGLLSQLCTPATPKTSKIRTSTGLNSSIETKLLAKPITYKLNARDHSLFSKNAAHFAHWGILYELRNLPPDPSSRQSSAEYQILVTTLPDPIAERCIVDTKHLLEVLRAEIWKREETSLSTSTYKTSSSKTAQPIEAQKTWLERLHDCPQGIIDMLNSRSCRSAIMFNDELTLAECETLVNKLSKCVFPFQCAHGRPSMVPIVDIGSEGGFQEGGFGTGMRKGEGKREGDFRENWKGFVRS
jgi:DNA mismatch repair protein MLH3